MVEHCIREMHNLSLRAGPSDHGLDAAAVLVVRMDNTNLPDTDYVLDPPAPAVGDPLHYDAFVQRLCAAYTERF